MSPDDHNSPPFHPLSSCRVVPLDQQAIARAEGVTFTADAAAPLSAEGENEAKIDIKITVAPNVTVRRGYFYPKGPKVPY